MDENRVTYGENESKWGFFLLENKKTIYRAFERIGISLKTDGSEDSEKMKFQGQDVGVPEGLILT